ncbi:MAG: thiol reductant ABC exporter subunit CydC [Acidobacteria bacterium]|nr:thiol reductant ABC exporter subunit CydC [Acidobacteriota bacterium]
MRTGPSPAADLRLLPRRRTVALAVASLAKAVGLVLLAEGVADGVAAAVHGRLPTSDVALVLVGALVRAGAAAWSARLASAAAADLKDGLRRALLTALVARGRTRSGSASVLATDGLDALDDHVGVALPALVEAAVVPLLVGLRILGADPLSAAIVAGTIWLVPLFMVLIGQHTRDHVARSADALARLSDHLVELARGLPVLVGLGRLDEQAARLRAVSDEHAARSVRVLRTAFLSALALELIGTIAVALVAVVIGLRLLVGDLPLASGLLVLLLAPECFTPIREVGAAFHQAQDGREAERRARAEIDAPRPRPVAADGIGVSVRHLTVRRTDGAEPVRDLELDVRHGELVLLAGGSGSGKSTVLDVLAGRGAALEADAVRGAIVRAASIAVLPQRPEFVAPTVGEELVAFGAHPGDTARLLATVDLRGLDPHADPARLSPGEGRRLALARVLVRVEAGACVVLLDEPTAHLDPATTSAVLRLLLHLRSRAAVLVASHDPAVAAIADRTVALDGAGPLARPGEDIGTARPVRPRVLQAPPAPPAPPGASLRTLAAVIAPAAPRLAGAALLSALASAFAVALLVLSGWLIVRAAEEPSIALVTVAMVGVRFFGIGRAALRYADRLGVHAAAFSAAGALRMRLWRGLARLGPASRSLLAPGATIQALVSDTDRLRDLLPRTVVPLVAGVVVLAAAAVAGGWIDPVAGLPVGLLAGLGAVVLPLAGGALASHAGRRIAALRSTALRRTAAVLTAAEDLAANGVAGAVVAGAADASSAADREEARLRRRVGLLRSLATLAAGGATAAVLVLVAQRVADGALAGPAAGALALLPLGLLPVLDDQLVAATRAVRLLPVLDRVAPLLDAADDVPAAGADPAPVHRLEIDDLAVRHPGAAAAVFTGLSAGAARGMRLAVVGPSGSGKSTLLAALLKYLPAAGGTIALDGAPYGVLSAAGVRRRIAWAPQEAHVFDSTLRGNMLLARSVDDRPTDAALQEVLTRVGLGPFVASSSAGLDTPVGPGGAFLSGGQRQRLAVARALLARADVLLLDEPTAHLDRASADALIADLDSALDDRIQVLVTHDEQAARGAASRVVLGRDRDPAAGTSRRPEHGRATLDPTGDPAGRAVLTGTVRSSACP